VLAGELTRRWESIAPSRAVSVTDLLAPRRAYWKATRGPVEPSPERAARIEEGRLVHRAIERLIAGEGAIEVRVRRAGVVGRLDALTDRPIEFKTTRFARAAAQVVSDRPEYVDQLAMYCALAGNPEGRLITAVPDAEAAWSVRVADLHFLDTASIEAEMHHRADRLREALARRTPSPLPRCPWFDRGCEYRDAANCDCTGEEVEEPRLAPESSLTPTERTDLETELQARLNAIVRSVRPAGLRRFRELIYPRRAYFDRTAVPSEEGEERAGTPGAPVSPTYERLVETIEGGALGEVARLPTRADEPEEEVPAFRGLPYLARTSRSTRVPGAEELFDRSPQYALELGFRCAATGTDIGRVIVVYERAADARDRLRVYELTFRPITAFSRLWRAREAALVHAVETGSFRELPACPSWMFPECPYRGDCGCDDPPDRSQR